MQENQRRCARRSFDGDVRPERSRGHEHGPILLAETGARLSRSVGWLSQVERGLSVPSIGDLRAFAELLGVPMSLLFELAKNLIRITPPPPSELGEPAPEPDELVEV